MKESSHRRIILKTGLAIGLIYGYIASLHNQDPYYPAPLSETPDELRSHLMNSEQYTAGAWHWQPSPVWLPSYLLSRFPGTPGIGIVHTK